MTRWNEIPHSEYAHPERTAAEFDAQFEENKAASEAKQKDTVTPNLDAYEARKDKK